MVCSVVQEKRVSDGVAVWIVVCLVVLLALVSGVALVQSGEWCVTRFGVGVAVRGEVVTRLWWDVTVTRQKLVVCL